MLAVEKWAEERGGLLLMAMPIEVASAADAVYEMCSKARNNELIVGDRGRPSLEDWIHLYRNHRQVSTVVVDSFGAVLFARAEEVESLIDNFAPVSEGTSLGALKEQFSDVFSVIESGLRDNLGDDSPPPENFLEILSTPEVLFYFRVTMPCWIVNGKSPCGLLRLALRGDEDSLLRLWNLDPWILEDPRLRRQLYELQRKPELASRVSKAMAGKLESPLKPAQVKVLLAGLIDRIYGELECKLSILRTQYPAFPLPSLGLEEPDIRALFDAVARDNGLEMDEDIPESPEAFYKAIYRARKFWSGPLPSFL